MAEAVKTLPAQHSRQETRQTAAELDPYEENGVPYLKAKGWRCLGNVQGIGWLDPNAPSEPTYRRVKRQAPNWKTGVLEDVIADDGTGKKVTVEQVIYDSPAEPMSLQQALMIQMERDRKARDKQRAA